MVVRLSLMMILTIPKGNPKILSPPKAKAKTSDFDSLSLNFPRRSPPHQQFLPTLACLTLDPCPITTLLPPYRSLLSTLPTSHDLNHPPTHAPPILDSMEQVSSFYKPLINILEPTPSYGIIACFTTTSSTRALIIEILETMPKTSTKGPKAFE